MSAFAAEAPTQVRATLCVEAGAESQRLNDWIDRWESRMLQCSDNLGCGCCVDLFEVEAPREALDELPAHFFAASQWSQDFTAPPRACPGAGTDDGASHVDKARP